MSAYIYLNGQYLTADSPSLVHTNRGFRYGDGLFESIRAYGSETPLFGRHFDRLSQSLDVLGMTPPPEFTKDNFRRIIGHLMLKNKIFKDGRVRLTMFRSGEGLYTPPTDAASVVIECSPLDENGYQLNKTGYKTEVYPELKKPVNQLSQIKSANALLYVMAARWRKENGYDDCLLMNDRGCLCESMSSNLFWVKDSALFTPALSTGCLPGVMRSVVIELAGKAQLTVHTPAAPTTADLLEADEIFLTNAIQGIRWVVAFRERRYYNTVAKALTKMLTTDLPSIAF